MILRHLAKTKAMVKPRQALDASRDQLLILFLQNKRLQLSPSPYPVSESDSQALGSLPVHALRLWGQTVPDGTTASQPDMQLLQPAQSPIVWLLALTVVCELMALAASEDPSTVQNGYTPTASPRRTQKPFPRSSQVAVRFHQENRILLALPVIASAAMSV